jgi:hypothetical protein
VGGSCSIVSCNGGYYDVDHSYSDGCECHDLGRSRACGTATALGTMPLGGSASPSGNLPVGGAENWFSVTFQGEGNKSYHPKIVLSGNGSEFKMDVLSGCPGQGGAMACGEAGTTSASTLTWEVSNSGGDANGVGCGDTSRTCNSCNCSSPWAPVPAVGNGGTVFIRVFRSGGAVTCDTFTLTISN